MDVPAETRAIWTVHVECRVQHRTTLRFETIKNLVHSYIQSSFSRISLPSVLEGWEDTPELAASIERIVACESSCPSASLPLEEMAIEIHVYQPTETDSFEDFSTSGSKSDEDETMAASVCELPNRGWEGLWDSLIYADDIKMKLLDYIHATLILSDANVDFNLVSWNRVLLLHGPPGTGKTSLCRALAQKLSIRLSHRYPHSRLLEINSHSLFSKWFSESGKLVQRLFSGINDLVDEEDTFVVVLIDEVESLTAARAGAMAGTEPSDGLRVVNALLTQLDKLKHKKNVLIMSTSNLAKAIDSAFVDRADIVQYVDLPPREAIYEILRTCLMEIIDKGVIAFVAVPSLKEAQMHELSGGYAGTSHEKSRNINIALKLLSLATECRKQGMSGRALRRLPVLALARYISSVPNVQSLSSKSSPKGVSTTKKEADITAWLNAIERVIKEQSTELGRLSGS